MTREEAVAVLKTLMENPLFSEVHKAAFNIAIHDIKQRHDWDINNLILINRDNYEPLDQEPRKDEVILTNKEYRELMANEYDHGYCKGYAEALEEQESILDKIRAEILTCLGALDEIEKSGINIYLPNEMSGRRLTYQQCLEFIDKYKAEAENEDGEY